MDSARLTGKESSGIGASLLSSKSQPAIPPSAMAAICPTDDGRNNAIAAAASANTMRIASGVRLRAMLHSACATTATAASLRPWIQGACAMLPSDVIR